MDLASPALDLETCPNCGEPNPARFRLCGFCGTALAADRPMDEIRRYVTVVNSDLKGSTALGEKLDPESLREVLTRYFDEMRIVFEAHGGTIEKIIGDAIVAVFGMPVRRDNDALRAVSAAAETMRVLASLNDQLEKVWGVRLVTRTGVATGEVVVGDVTASQHVLTGDTMKVSSAMEQNAPPLEVLMAQSTYDLVREFVEIEPMGPITPKGMEGATEAYRIVSVNAPAHPRDTGLDGAVATTGETRHCSNCGEENSDRQRLCGMCGTPLVVVAKAGESRKTVTLVFADPKPRTDSGEPPSPEALRDVMSRYFDEMKRALERHGGTVEKFIGDAVMAVYGLPVRHEDDAVRALRAALDMQAALPALNEDFAAKWGVRLLNAIGVNTGEVIAGDSTLGQRLVTGDAVNVAARLEQAAGPAEVIIGDLTYRLAKEFAEVEVISPLTLKGKAEPVPAYRLLAVREAPVDAGSGVSPFVGREAEMARLSDALFDAEGHKAARMVTVIGDAGVGKSRLIMEFAVTAAGQAKVARGRCLPYGDGITFWPLAEVVREAAGIAADDSPVVAVGKIGRLMHGDGSVSADSASVVDRVAAAIGLSNAQYPVAELFWGARKLLESMARSRPLVMIVDDIHSGESTFLDLLDHLLEAVDDASILLLCSARHELLEAHPEWSERHSAQQVILEPLSEADSGLFIEQLLGQAGLDEAVVARIATAAEGNPLFVEQMVSMLIESGMIRQEDGRWVATSASQIAVPPTIHALLAARFDSLGAEERGVLEPASVIGFLFPPPAVEELVPDSIRPSVLAHLVSLDRKQFVKPTTLEGDDEAYRFAHLLVRDTAYGSLLKRSRASYHEQFAAWAERVNRERGREQEFEEILGYHLEQAYRYRTELGVVDEVARALGRRGAVKLTSAGQRAFARGDAHAAANLIRRAVGLLPDDDRWRIELLPDLAEALKDLGEFVEAGTILDEAARGADLLADPRLDARVRLSRLAVNLYSGTTGPLELAIPDVERMIRVLEEADDLIGLASAWRVLLLIHGTSGQFDRGAEAAERVVGYAKRAGERRLLGSAAVNYAVCAWRGPITVQKAIERCEELAETVRGDRRSEALIFSIVAVLQAMEGRFDRARDLSARSREMLVDLGASITAAQMSVESSCVEILAGDYEAAIRVLTQGYEALEAVGETYFRSTIAGYLGQCLWATGRHEEADRYARIAEELADPDDYLSQISWRMTRAKLMAAAGSADESVAMARAAIALAETTDDTDTQAGGLTDLGIVLALAGRPDEQGLPVGEALALYEQKGNLVRASMMRDLLRASAVDRP